MDLLDRYVYAVKKRLPRDQRDDIAAELRDVLLSQIEAEQGALGRPLSDEEVAVMLKRFGRPQTVAVDLKTMQVIARIPVGFVPKRIGTLVMAQ